MKVDIINIEGKSTGQQVNLPKAIFDTPKHEHAVYLAVKAQLANMRQGTHSTKTRTEVSGGGRKPWKQKGRGVARAGSTRSGLWVGGGRIFGPKPRNYSERINKKVKKLARKSVLADKLREGMLQIIEDFTVDSGKTKDFAKIVDALKVEKNKALFLTQEVDQNLLKACKNIPRISVLRADLVSTYDLVKSNQIFIQKGAIKKLQEVLV